MSNYIDNIVKNAVTYDLVSKPIADDIANEFSIQSTYSVGDYVMYDYKLYKCISAVTTAGNWNSAKWQECKIGDEVNGSVKYTAQTLTTEQKAQTRANIGAISQEEATPDAIRYSAQSLTDAQKNQARVNVGTVASTSIAEEFSTSKAYAVGDMVMYDSKLYKFKTAHSAGAWNNAQVDAVSVKEEISNLSNDLSECVRVTAQTLTEAQKIQAKINLGIVDGLTDDIKNALLLCMRSVPFADDNNAYISLYNALYPDETIIVYPSSNVALVAMNYDRNTINGAVHMTLHENANRRALVSMSGILPIYNHDTKIQTIYYPLLVPDGTTSIKITTDNGWLISPSLWQYWNGRYVRYYDPGYSIENSATWTGFAYYASSYMGVNFKSKDGHALSDNEYPNSIVIEFENP